MSREYIERCPCGSGLGASICRDARGIPIGYTCETCHEKKVAKYRPEIFTDPNYDTYDEQVDEDY